MKQAIHINISKGMGLFTKTKKGQKMEDLTLLIDLHKGRARQGPGGKEETLRAASLVISDSLTPLKIADIGCGTGASTLLLAQTFNAHVTAVDFLPEFIHILEKNTQGQGLAKKISPLVCSMDALPFAKDEYDVIWSEGAVYNMGFEKGITYWKQFLKPGGILAASEITWTTATRPAELQEYWENIYPEVDTTSGKIKVLEQHGYSPVGYFTLPEHCWLENYYQPLEDSFQDFLQRKRHSEQARAIVQAEQKEIAMYKKYHSFYSYGFYIAKKQSIQTDPVWDN